MLRIITCCVVVLFLPVWAEKTCEENTLSTFYRELDCKPNSTDAAGCPLSYDCSEFLARDPKKCYLNGKEYKEGDEIDDARCLASCHCGKGYTDVLGPVCVNVECPENLGYKPEKNCRLVHELNSCCFTKTVCETEEVDKVVCNVDNSTYKAGQRFWPEKEPCKSCVCKEEFRGLLEEPFCAPVQCNVLVHYNSDIKKGCAPVFYSKEGCCPIIWKCPDSKDAVAETPAASKAEGVDSCKFGDLKIAVGQSLVKSDGQPTCTCENPPYLTCIN